MKHPFALLFALMAVAVLLGVGGMMNNACKSGPHAWCAPAPKIHQAASRSQEGNAAMDRSAVRDRSSSQR